MKLESVNAYEGIDDVNALVEIWPGRDIAAGWRDIETPCASLPTRSPSQPCTPARKAGVVDLRKWVRARDWLSLLAREGSEPSVPVCWGPPIQDAPSQPPPLVPPSPS